MANKNVTKRAFVSSVMALILCFTMLLGTTFAWFTDSVTSTGNKIQAGTLDVELYMWTSATTAEKISERTEPIFGSEDALAAQNNTANTLWEPGKTQVVYFSIKNEGDLALMYKVDLNVTGITKNLNEAVLYSIKRDAKFGEVTAWDGTNAKYVNPGVNATEATGVELEANEEHFFALSVHMDELAGNEYQDGSIVFDMTVFATQLTSEFDSFNDQYDAAAAFPKNAVGYTVVDKTAPVVEVTSYDSQPDDHNAQKQAYASIPAAALVEDAEDVAVSIVQRAEVDSNVVVETDQGAVTFDIVVTNIKENNDKEITFSLRVGTGLTGVKLFHNNVEITDAYYDGEYIEFKTKSFSPFTVVYDLVAKEEPKDDLKQDVPTALVTDADECENVTLAWTGWGGYNPYAGADQKLDSVYLFVAPHDGETVKENLYKDWYCDYYVMLDSDTLSTLPEGSITLGGNYGGYGWVGFDNPTVNTNTFIPLLGSVLGECDENGTMVDTYWTYQRVVNLVEEFWCGVAVSNGNTTDLSDAKFVVELRLTNPDNFDDYIVTNRVTYTFNGGVSVIE